jgi:hypothetical protein
MFWTAPIWNRFCWTMLSWGISGPHNVL